MTFSKVILLPFKFNVIPILAEVSYLKFGFIAISREMTV